MRKAAHLLTVREEDFASTYLSRLNSNPFLNFTPSDHQSIGGCFVNSTIIVYNRVIGCFIITILVELRCVVHDAFNSYERVVLPYDLVNLLRL